MAQTKRQPLKSKLRRAVLQRDNFSCCVCNEMSSPTIDHKMPISKGGTNDINNLWVLCWQCNAEKHDRNAEEYFNWFRVRRIKAGFSVKDVALKLRVCTATVRKFESGISISDANANQICKMLGIDYELVTYRYANPYGDCLAKLLTDLHPVMDDTSLAINSTSGRYINGSRPSRYFSYCLKW